MKTKTYEINQSQQYYASEKNRRQRQPKRILVLGAGVSGLACARELKQRGYEVLIVEARTRVGGRLKGEPLELGAEYPASKVVAAAVSASPATTRSASPKASTSSPRVPTTTKHCIDLGGALIHGIDDNPMYQITSQMGVPIHPISEYCLLLDDNGWPIDPKLDEKTSTFFNECLDRAFAQAEQDRTSTQSFGSLYSAVCREKLGIDDATDDNNNWENPLLLWHRRNLELSIGNAFESLSYTWNEDEPYGFDGAHAAIEPSWKLVMEQLAEDLDIIHGNPVTQIRVVLPDRSTPKEMPEGEQGGEVADHSMERNNVRTLEQNGGNAEKTDDTLEQQVATETEEKQPDAIIASAVPLAGAVNGKARQASKKKKPVKSSCNPVLRVSRRIRGDDANVRRSARSTKGIIQMLQIGQKHSACYDEPDKKSRQKKRPKRRLDQFDPDDKASNDDSKLADDIEPSSSIQVKLQDGTVLEGDAVVCTLPLGVLKAPTNQAGHIQFLPPLPSPKQNAIQQLGCGLLNKCALSFPKVFWQDSDFLGMADKEYSYLILNTVPYTQKPILIFMYGGAFAREIEDWTDAEVVGDCLEVLKRSCGKEVPDPVDYCVTRWGKEQFSKMSFTYIPPGVDGPKELGIMSEAIYDPIQKKRPLVMFAGEHTTAYHPSTMHGAFLSGIREAYRYDLFMEPALNDHMEFQDSEHIYQHTFHMKRVFRNSSSPKPKKKNGVNSPSKAAPRLPTSKPPPSARERRSRRRGFGGMTLRSRPKATPPPTPSSPSRKINVKKSGKGLPGSGTRRSQRSIAPLNLPTTLVRSPLIIPENLALSAGDPRKARADLDRLEDRTLIRALDSFGRDFALIRSKVLPIYGLDRTRSAVQIENRLQQLTKEPTRIHEDILSKWKAVSVGEDESSNETQLQMAEEDASAYSFKRKSRRSVKPRLNLEAQSNYLDLLK